MKKTLKRMLALLLTLCMALGSLSLTAMADETATTPDGTKENPWEAEVNGEAVYFDWDLSADSERWIKIVISYDMDCEFRLYEYIVSHKITMSIYTEGNKECAVKEVEQYDPVTEVTLKKGTYYVGFTSTYRENFNGSFEFSIEKIYVPTKIEVTNVRPYMYNFFDTDEDYRPYNGNVGFTMTDAYGEEYVVDSYDFSDDSWYGDQYYVAMRPVDDAREVDYYNRVPGVYSAVLEAYHYDNDEKKIYATSAPFDYTIASVEESLAKAATTLTEIYYNTKTTVNVAKKTVEDEGGGYTNYLPAYLKFTAQYDGYHVFQNVDGVKQYDNWYINYIYTDGESSDYGWYSDDNFESFKLKQGQTYIIKLRLYDYNNINSYNFSIGYFGGRRKPVETEKKIPVTAVTLNQSALTVNVGSKALLSATVAPENSSYTALTWTSSNTDVATVGTNGMVYGVGAGTAVITATAHNGVKASCTVTVNPVYVNGILISKTVAEVTKGKKLNLLAVAGPAGVSNGVLEWTSSNPAIATVDANGVVTGIKGGTVQITAAATDGSGQKVTCKVTVVSPATKVAVAKKTVYLAKGKSTTLATIVTPLDSTDKVTFTSSNKKVATVNAKGKVTAKKKGTATITVKAGKKSVKVKVKVASSATKVKTLSFAKKTITVNTGKVQFLSYKVKPSTATAALTWKTSNKKVVTVSNGKITAKKAGTAKITVSSGKVKATITVKVK